MNWTELEVGLVPETKCGFIIVPAIARHANIAATIKNFSNLVIVASPFLK